MLTPEETNDLIRRRRAIYPDTYQPKPIPKAIVEQILENANWAPNHKRTEPWRFRVFYGEARRRLSDFLGDWYREHTPEDKFSERKYKKTLAKPMQSGCVIAVCMQRDPQERLPEWEELAAVACAVQNMWLTCTAYNIGCYWSTPQAILEAGEFLQLKEGERCLGLFYMGYHQMPDLEGKRGDVREKVIWWEE